MESKSRCLLYFILIICIIASSSCATYPKIAELEPIPQYGPERTDWDTSAKCVVMQSSSAKMADANMAQIYQQSYGGQVRNFVHANSTQAACLQMVRLLEDRGYTIVPEETGYLTRAERKAVDKVISVNNCFSNYIYGSDGTCTQAQIAVSVYDIEQGKTVATASARSRVFGEKKEPAKHDQAMEQAIKNLLTLESFRSTL